MIATALISNHEKHPILPIHMPPWSCGGGTACVMLLTSLLFNPSFSFMLITHKPPITYRTEEPLCDGELPVFYGELELFFVRSPVVCSVERATGSLTRSGSMTAG